MIVDICIKFKEGVHALHRPKCGMVGFTDNRVAILTLHIDKYITEIKNNSYFR